MTIDELMNQFRLASREIFNQYFRHTPPWPTSKDGFALEERFKSVREVLFEKMVTEPANIKVVAYGEVQPNIGVKLKHGDFAPILINREFNSGYWDHPVREVPTEAVLVFECFFDFDCYDYHDNQYVRVSINNWPSHPELIGKDALIESQYVRYELIEI